MKGIIDCSELRKTLKDNPDAEAFNGVAFDETTKTFYITGKYWNTMFEIKVEDLFLID
jgi:glutamine cyclotransferase